MRRKRSQGGSSAAKDSSSSSSSSSSSFSSCARWLVFFWTTIQLGYGSLVDTICVHRVSVLSDVDKVMYIEHVKITDTACHYGYQDICRPASFSISPNDWYLFNAGNRASWPYYHDEPPMLSKARTKSFLNDTLMMLLRLKSSVTNFLLCILR